MYSIVIYYHYKMVLILAPVHFKHPLETSVFCWMKAHTWDHIIGVFKIRRISRPFWGWWTRDTCFCLLWLEISKSVTQLFPNPGSSPVTPVVCYLTPTNTLDSSWSDWKSSFLTKAEKRIRCTENFQDARYTILLIEHVQQHAPLCLFTHSCLSCWCLRLCLRTVDHCQKNRIHLTECKFIMKKWRRFNKRFLSNRWIMKKQPLQQVQRLQLPAWDNCKSFQTRPESCGSLSPCPLENTKYSNPKSRLKIADNDSQCHSWITFAWHFPSPNESSNQDQMSQFHASAAGVSWGVSAFAFRREQVHSKRIGWQPWLHWKTPKPTPERNGFQVLFSSVAVCGSFALVST